MKFSTAQFDIQGHRGCRGLYPENTIPAFLKAVELGVTTLELDVVITADHQVLVSHDPFMSHEICLAPGGSKISKSDENNHNIYLMNYASTLEYDCGTSGNKKFPDQKKMKVSKPLLSDVIDAVENYVSENHLPPVNYNIETKCTRAGDNKFHPAPDIFSDLLLDVVLKKNIASRVMIQSFDVRTLQHLQHKKGKIKLVLLIENTRSINYNLKKLGFNPDVYSPYFHLVSGRKVKTLHEMGIKIIPWTVNKESDMKKLISMGVDGIITDYPDRLINLVRNEQR